MLDQSYEAPLPMNPVPAVSATCPRTPFTNSLDEFIRADYPRIAEAARAMSRAIAEAYVVATEAYAERHQGYACEEAEVKVLLDVSQHLGVLAMTQGGVPDADQLDRLEVAFAQLAAAHGVDFGEYGGEIMEDFVAAARRQGYLN